MLVTETYAFNNVEFPFRFFEEMNQNSNWEFITLRLKEEFISEADDPLVGVMFAYQTKESYCAVLLGMNYHYSREHKIYKQILFHATMRAHALGQEANFSRTNFWAREEKVRSTLISQVGYLTSSG